MGITGVLVLTPEVQEFCFLKVCTPMKLPVLAV